tara:strand:- start:833 stop:1903 length:1071 start_codon:yes stop_codon:yes gene_type:complete
VLNILLFCAFFNFPIIEIGEDAIGFFDVLFVIVIPLLINTRLHKSNVFFFFFGTFFLLLTISSAVNSLNYGISFQEAIYLLKILELALIPLVITNILKAKLQYHANLFYFDRLVYILSVLLFIFSVYQIAFLGWHRSGVPFAYGSSGPLGLIGSGLVIYAYFSVNYKYRIMMIGVLIMLLALSKSFLLAVAAILVYRFRYYYNFRVVALVAVVFLMISLSGGFIAERIESIIYALQNFQDLDSLSFRFSRHWFVLWDDHLRDYRLFIGGGVQSITLSFDSLYFYCFYTIGIFGSLILFLCGLLLSIKYEIFRLYFIVALVSGIFLEASLISYRGLEPLLIFLTYANFTYERMRYER